MFNKRPPVDKRSVSKRDFDRLPKFQEGGFAVLNRILPSEKKKMEETAKYYDTYNELVNRYNRELEDYQGLYGRTVDEYNQAVRGYESDYESTVGRYNKALEDYNRQAEEFDRTQVNPYNAALLKYQQDQEAYAKAYQDYENQYLAAQQAYEQQYADYEKAYQKYLQDYAGYEASFPEYEKRFNEYQNTYNAAFKKYEQEVDAYNKLMEAYQNTYVMGGPDTYATYQLGGKVGNVLQNVATPGSGVLGLATVYDNNLLFTRDPGSGLYLRRQSPTESRALEINQVSPREWQYIDPVTKQVLFTAYGAKGAGNTSPTFQQRVGQDYYLTGRAGGLTANYFKEPTASVPNAPAFTPPANTVPEPQFTIQAPTPQLPSFTAREPSFTREAPVFNVQQPQFVFDRAAPEFRFDAPEPQRPKDPEMTPEQLQEYQARAQKMAGYRSSGLEKAFEMGIAPEIAQYFKRGVM